MQGGQQRGRLIVIEGVDGAGKSAVAAALIDQLRVQGWSAIATREPGGTALGERIRGIVLDSAPVPRSPIADALLFSAARAQLMEEVIRPALARGDIVVCDRFATSTLAYQGYGDGLDRQQLLELEWFATGGLKPDVIVLLDVVPELGLRRRAQSHPSSHTRFEARATDDEAFQQRVASGYREMAANDPDRWLVIAAERTAAEVASDVVGAVSRVLDADEPNAPLSRMNR